MSEISFSFYTIIYIFVIHSFYYGTLHRHPKTHLFSRFFPVISFRMRSSANDCLYLIWMTFTINNYKMTLHFFLKVTKRSSNAVMSIVFLHSCIFACITFRFMVSMFVLLCANERCSIRCLSDREATNTKDFFALQYFNF